MTRLTLLFVVAALVIPGAAFAMPAQDLTAPDREQPTAAPVNAPGTDVAADFRARNGDVAARDAKWRAVEAYYASYGNPKPIAAPAPAAVADDRTGPSWFGALGIGVALMLLAGGLGVYAGRTLRPRHLGA
jgi:hypothetical protein